MMHQTFFRCMKHIEKIFVKEKSATQVSTGFMCLDLMSLQYKFHTAVQTNDFDMKLDAWSKMLPN